MMVNPLGALEPPHRNSACLALSAPRHHPGPLRCLPCARTEALCNVAKAYDGCNSDKEPKADLDKLRNP